MTIHVFHFAHGTQGCWAYSREAAEAERAARVANADANLVSHGWITKVQQIPQDWLDSDDYYVGDDI